MSIEEQQKVIDAATAEFKELGVLLTTTYFALSDAGVDARLFLDGLEAAA